MPSKAGVSVPYVQLEAGNVKKDPLLQLKIYMMFTGQFWPLTHNHRRLYTKGIVSFFIKAVIMIYTILYILYALDMFHCRHPLCIKVINLDFNMFPLTTVDDAIWELRWLVTCWLGIIFTSSIWSKLFEEGNVVLKEKDCSRVRWFVRILGFLIIVMCIANVITSLVEIDFQITHDIAVAIFVDCLLRLFDRVFASPIFLLLCTTLYILCCMVEEFKADIVAKAKEVQQDENEQDQDLQTDIVAQAKEVQQNANQQNQDPPAINHDVISSGENEARKKFCKIKTAIRETGFAFQLFLMLHFLLLLTSFFVGVAACVEQIEVTVDGPNNSIVSKTIPFQMLNSARFLKILKSMPATKSKSNNEAETLKTLVMSNVQGRVMLNYTSDDNPNEMIQKLAEKSINTFLVKTIMKTLESLLLYLFPIGLMVRLQNRLNQAYQVIEDCDLEEQEKKGYIFLHMYAIRRMCKYVKTAQGLKIFGYSLPTFQAFILAAFGPFLGVVLHGIFIHIHAKQK